MPPAGTSHAATAFAGGALARGLLGLAFALAAFALVWAIEAVPLAGEPSRAAPTAVAPVAERTVSVESTYAVAAGGWSVAVGGKPVGALRSDDAGWSGSVGAGEVVITASPADAGDGRLHALRARVAAPAGANVDAHEQVAWGVGAVTLVVAP